MFPVPSDLLSRFLIVLSMCGVVAPPAGPQLLPSSCGSAGAAVRLVFFPAGRGRLAVSRNGTGGFWDTWTGPCPSSPAHFGPSTATATAFVLMSGCCWHQSFWCVQAFNAVHWPSLKLMTPHADFRSWSGYLQCLIQVTQVFTQQDKLMRLSLTNRTKKSDVTSQKQKIWKYSLQSGQLGLPYQHTLWTVCVCGNSKHRCSLKHSQTSNTYFCWLSTSIHPFIHQDRMWKVTSRRSSNRGGESLDRVTEETHQQLPRSHIQNIQWKKDRGWGERAHPHMQTDRERESTLKWRQLSPETEDGGMKEPPVAPKNDRILNPYFFSLPLFLLQENPLFRWALPPQRWTASLAPLSHSAFCVCNSSQSQHRDGILVPPPAVQWAVNHTGFTELQPQQWLSQSTAKHDRAFLLKLTRQFHINLCVCSRSTVWRCISATFKPFIWGLLLLIIKSDFKNQNSDIFSKNMTKRKLEEKLANW